MTSTQVRWFETLLSSHGARCFRGFIFISAKEAEIPGEFSVRQASSCNQSNWSEKKATKNPWEPVVVFGRSNYTCIDPTRDPKNEDQSQDGVHCIRDIVHMKSVNASYVAMTRKRVSKEEKQQRLHQRTANACVAVSVDSVGKPGARHADLLAVLPLDHAVVSVAPLLHCFHELSASTDVLAVERCEAVGRLSVIPVVLFRSQSGQSI